MPLVNIYLSNDEKADKNKILKSVSGIVTKITGKPESYVMVTIQPTDGIMGGKDDPLAFIEVRGIGGLDNKTNSALSKDICETLNKNTGIPEDRIYINFMDIQASSWGWKGGTFG